MERIHTNLVHGRDFFHKFQAQFEIAQHNAHSPCTLPKTRGEHSSMGEYPFKIRGQLFVPWAKTPSGAWGQVLVRGRMASIRRMDFPSIRRIYWYSIRRIHFPSIRRVYRCSLPVAVSRPEIEKVLISICIGYWYWCLSSAGCVPVRIYACHHIPDAGRGLQPVIYRFQLTPSKCMQMSYPL